MTLIVPRRVMSGSTLDPQGLVGQCESDMCQIRPKTSVFVVNQIAPYSIHILCNKMVCVMTEKFF